MNEIKEFDNKYLFFNNLYKLYTITPIENEYKHLKGPWILSVPKPYMSNKNAHKKILINKINEIILILFLVNKISKANIA